MTTILGAKFVHFDPSSDPAMGLIASIKVQGNHVCNGVFIGENAVLTTGHCLSRHKQEIEAITVEPNYDNVVHLPSNRSKSYHVKRIFTHPDLEKNMSHDVSVAELTETVVARSISPAEMEATHPFPDESDELEGDKKFRKMDNELYAIIGAWGYTKRGEMTEHLKLNRVRLLSSSDCEKRFRLDKQTVDHLICGRSFHSMICNGDSGAPIFLLNWKTGEKTLHGLLGFSAFNCSTDQFLAIRIADNYDWIDAILEKTKNPLADEKNGEQK